MSRPLATREPFCLLNSPYRYPYITRIYFVYTKIDIRMPFSTKIVQFFEKLSVCCVCSRQHPFDGAEFYRPQDYKYMTKRPDGFPW
ncbi:hypothetical protein ATCV1_z013L [Acanthocystis turfacea chlorella virus 1]|uniref:Uncharacterized protein z013L n=1 Tax=Chlorovirus heliozoae TaxID=322019 RepID=A7K7X3_9PHYC|nr:hypothetical protein ATCV1_z013L [Acanthocystis turfacea chlorella virus 1]ABT16147.1 hypothetical protein ATCV1_z013L [Acanthocystis turfacea chlorella virus 1]